MLGVFSAIFDRVQNAERPFSSRTLRPARRSEYPALPMDKSRIACQEKKMSRCTSAPLGGRPFSI